MKGRKNPALRVMDKPLLPVLRVQISGSSTKVGNNPIIYMLLDTASEDSYICDTAVKLAKLGKFNKQVETFQGIAGVESSAEIYFTELFIHSVQSDFVFKCKLKVLPIVCGNIPPVTQHADFLNSFPDRFTEIFPRDEQVVSILIGANLLNDILDSITPFKCGASKLLLYKTVFGPTCSGNLPVKIGTIPIGKTTRKLLGVQPNQQLGEKSISDLLAQFFSWEQLALEPVEQSTYTVDELYVFKQFENTVLFKDNRYFVRLPWNSAERPMNNSRAAIQHFYSLERRLAKLGETPAVMKFIGVIDEQISSGILKEVNNPDLANPHSHYLSVFPVAGHTTTTAIRPVYQCNLKASNGQSLNTLLLPGANLLPNLLHVLFKFRTYKYPLIADVRRMFHSIGVQDLDLPYLSCIWRTPNSDEPLKVYHFTRLPFGAICSPSLAILTMQKHLEKYGNKFPETIAILKSQFYMDDFVGGGDSEAELLTIYKQTTLMCNEGGFQLHKWLTTCKKALLAIPEEERDPAANIVLTNTKQTSTDAEITRVLGLMLLLRKDAFVFDDLMAIDITEKPHVFRDVASIAASIYDIAGMLNPTVLVAKLIIQDCWKEKLAWNDQLTPKLAKRWNEFLRGIPILATFSIPRRITIDDAVLTQLLVTSDASNTACSACLHVRSVSKSGQIFVNLLAAKCKINSLVPSHISHLEIAGAILACRLAKLAMQFIHFDEVLHFTDNSNLVQWTRMKVTDLRVFHANRISKIKEMFPDIQYLWLKSEHMPADLNSRGCTALELVNSTLWKAGPAHWSKPQREWPNEPLNHRYSMVLSDEARLHSCKHDEKRGRSINLPAKTTVVSKNLQKKLAKDPKKRVKKVNPQGIAVFDPVAAEELLDVKNPTRAKPIINEKLHYNQEILDRIFKRSNNYFKTQRTLALILGLINHKRWLNPNRSVEPGIKEIRQSNLLWIKYVQQEAFQAEFAILREGKYILSAPLKALTPFLSEENIITTYGRLGNANLAEQTRFPPILPANSLLVRNYLLSLHQALYHASVETLLAYTRASVYIVSGRRQIRHAISLCKCFRFKTKPYAAPLMSNLPARRINFAAAYTDLIIDIAGPFVVTALPRTKKEKPQDISVWCLLISCALTRHLSIQILTSIDTQNTINALLRHFSVYSMPRSILCDNGTQFKSTAAIFEHINVNKVKTFFAHSPFHSVTFYFGAANAPFMQGAIEIYVRRFKQSMHQAFGCGKVDFETFRTNVAIVAGLINSRPISSYVAAELEEALIITPQHLVYSKPLYLLPTDDIKHKPTSTGVMWTDRKNLANKFWLLFKKHYLLTLLKRSKWVNPTTAPKVGEIVLLTQENEDRGSWRTGRIVQLFPSASDNIIRSVNVFSNGRIVSRAVSRLCRLERWEEDLQAGEQ